MSFTKTNLSVSVCISYLCFFDDIYLSIYLSIYLFDTCGWASCTPPPTHGCFLRFESVSYRACPDLGTVFTLCVQYGHNLARDKHGRHCERWQVGPIAEVGVDLQTEPGRARRTWRHRYLWRRIIAAATDCAGYATTRATHELHAEATARDPADANEP